MADPGQERDRLLSLLDERLQELAEVQLGRALKRLSSLSIREHRRRRVVEILDKGCDRLAYLVIRWLWRTSQQQDPFARELLLDLVTARPLVETIGYTKVRALYTLARLNDDDEVGRLFLSSPSGAEKILVKGVEVENRAMGDTSLGLRKAYARGRDRFKLDRLVVDLNPMVIRNLLRNPLLVERDAVRIAAQKPTNAEVLEEVYRSQRWITRYKVKKALVFNRHTPLDIALALLPHLHRPDLRDAARSSLLGEEIRVVARRILAGPG